MGQVASRLRRLRKGRDEWSPLGEGSGSTEKPERKRGKRLAGGDEDFAAAAQVLNEPTVPPNQSSSQAVSPVETSVGTTKPG